MHPNTITYVALVTGVLAGVSYWLTSRSPAFFFLGGFLVLVSGIGDALDGDVARRFGRTSPAGDFMDHFFDRIVNICILGGLALSPHATTALGLAVIIVVLLNSYIGTQIEASFGKRFYTGLGKLELFIGLVVGSVVLGFYPGVALTVRGRALSLLDLFFILIAVMTVQALVYRFRLAMRLASGSEE